MGVPHEPETFTGRAVSPRHLFLMCFEDWRPPEGTHVVVMLRNPVYQVTSAANRWKALGGYNKRKRDWIRRVPSYLDMIEKIVREHRSLLHYERVTSSHQQLLIELQNAGLPTDAKWSDDRVNRFEGGLKNLPVDLAATAFQILERYAKVMKMVENEEPACQDNGRDT